LGSVPNPLEKIKILAESAGAAQQTGQQ
jgi:hypothetical protein